MKHPIVKYSVSIATLSILLMSCGGGQENTADNSNESNDASVAEV